jgi:predicted nuclease with TOPRIM domain
MANNDQKLKKDFEELKITNTDLGKKLGVVSGELTKANKKIEEDSKLSDQLKTANEKIQALESEKSKLEKVVGKVSGTFPKLPLIKDQITENIKICEAGFGQNDDMRKVVFLLTTKKEGKIMMTATYKDGKCVDVNFQPILK